MTEAATRVRELVAAPGLLLVVSDFDGTLATIQLDPGAARIVPLAQQALRRLARIAAARPERLAVMILSGRGARDVAGRVRVGGIAYHGNHGIEAGQLARRDRAERLVVRGDPSFDPFVSRAGRLGAAVAARLGTPPWLFVEDKGPTVAFHFRQAADGDAARAALLEAIAVVETELGEHGLVALEGRKVIEFRPVGAGGKGTAVGRLVDRLSPAAVLVLGDDVSDAEAFDVVREARSAGRLRGLAIAVHASRETPPAVRAAADLELPDPVEAARVLSLLASLLERETPAT